MDGGVDVTLFSSFPSGVAKKCVRTRTRHVCPGDERDAQDTSQGESRRERDMQDTPTRSLETRNPARPGGALSGHMRWLLAALASLTALEIRHC